MEKLFVAAGAVLNAVGGDPVMAGIASRSGISGAAETGIMASNDEPIRQCLVPSDALSIFEDDASLNTYGNRLAHMCHYGIGQLISASKLRTPVPLFLALPQRPPGTPEFSNGKQIFDSILAYWTEEIITKDSRVFASGRVGGAYAIDFAFRYMASTGADLAIVGGVESYNDLMLLSSLEEQGRLNISGTFDGFIPGEGSGFILLASRALKERLEKPWVSLSCPNFGKEPGHLYSEEACLGEGLTNVFRSAIQCGPNKGKISTIHASINGEGYWSKELGIARIRNSDSFSDAVVLEHIADCVGDIGAAYVPTVIAIQQAMSISHTEIISASSDLEDRAACILAPS